MSGPFPPGPAILLTQQNIDNAPTPELRRLLLARLLFPVTDDFGTHIKETS